MTLFDTSQEVAAKSPVPSRHRKSLCVFVKGSGCALQVHYLREGKGREGGTGLLETRHLPYPVSFATDCVEWMHRLHAAIPASHAPDATDAKVSPTVDSFWVDRVRSGIGLTNPPIKVGWQRSPEMLPRE